MILLDSQKQYTAVVRETGLPRILEKEHVHETWTL
jgi:hypothetical protein